ncbi:ABC transporter ATP-binding protein [Mycolicibacterium sp. CH28]|uniref:ABC transporter ATP-binding protein n=1 Tax=Mycolicibacterium sp. CH28 TaxID=2512237 RepID=UPI00107FF408|nr:ABC transporter ATP-binding protein [Mycolicibacterium sp. CH28]TGD87501.1 ABC transporter ATP-binding protein [Mycolicibacterium sp. CH28]
MTDTAPSLPAVALRSVRREFGDHAAVESLDLDIAEGEFFSIIGPSGCGKTTTLRMVAGLEQPTSGHILIHGRDVTNVPAFRRPVHTVFQNYALFPHLTVLQNVQFGLREHKVPKDEARARAAKTLELVDLAGFESRKPAELSGGMQQRVALARALVLNPEVLLLDEPLGALDLKLRRQLQIMLKEVQRQVGITFLYVTHDQEEAFSMSDRVGIMHRGNLVQVSPPRELYERPLTLFVADFVGSSNKLPASVTAVSGSDYQIDLAGRGLRVGGAADLPAGADCVAILRPEKVRWAELEDADVVTEAVIKDIAYLGSSTIVTVQTAVYGDLTMAGASQHLPALGRGDSVRIGWDAADLWVVAA